MQPSRSAFSRMSQYLLAGTLLLSGCNTIYPPSVEEDSNFADSKIVHPEARLVNRYLNEGNRSLDEPVEKNVAKARGSFHKALAFYESGDHVLAKLKGELSSYLEKRGDKLKDTSLEKAHLFYRLAEDIRKFSPENITQDDANEVSEMARIRIITLTSKRTDPGCGLYKLCFNKVPARGSDIQKAAMLDPIVERLGNDAQKQNARAALYRAWAALR